MRLVTANQRSILELIAPQFAAETDPTIDGTLALADMQVSQTAFGQLRDAAVAYLAAHMLVLRSRKGKSGQVVGTKEGDLQIQYSDIGRSLARVGGGANSLDTTSYGQEYSRMCSQAIMGPMISGPCFE